MRKLILFLLFTAIVAILAFPGMALTSAKDGLVLWAASLVPTLFPFMVITSLIVQYSGARGKSVFGQCVFAGIVSGYPVGAASAYLLKQQGADEEQVSTLAAFASFCSPGFMLSTIGTGLFGDSRMGLAVAIAHYASWLAMWITYKLAGGLRFGKIAAQQEERPVVFSHALKNSVENGINSILCVGGYVVLFSILISLVQKFSMSKIPAFVNCLFGTLLELDNGAILTCQSGLPVAVQAAFLSFGVTWGGGCVVMQITGIVGNAKKIALFQLVRGIVAAFFGWTAACIWFQQPFGTGGILLLLSSAALLCIVFFCQRKKLKSNAWKPSFASEKPLRKWYQLFPLKIKQQ